MPALNQKSGFLDIFVHDFYLGDINILGANGSYVPALQLVKSVAVNLVKGKPDTFSIVFVDPDLSFMNSKLIQPFHYVTIYCGWQDEITAKGPYRITSMKYSFPENGGPELLIEGTDKSVSKLGLQARSKELNNRFASQVIEDIAKHHDLDVDINISKEEDLWFDEEYTLTQTMESDMQLLQRLAMKMGYIWGVRENTVYFQRPDLVEDNILLLEWRMGKRTLKSFNPDIKLYVPGSGKKTKACKPFAFLDVKNAAVAHAGQVNDYKELVEGVGVVDTQYMGGGIVEGEALAEVLALEHAEGGSAIRQSIENIRNPATRSDVLGKYLRQALDGSATTGTSQPDDGGIDPSQYLSTGQGKDRNYISNVGGRTVTTTKVTRVGASSGDKVTTTVVHVKNNNDVVVEGVRGDAGGKVPSTPKKAKKHAGKRGRTRDKVVGATMVPSIPSWRWDVKKSVYVVGVADICEGLYIIEEVNLTYDNSNGLGTTLKGKKGTLGRKKRCGKKSKIICVAKGSGVNGAINEALNPRQPKSNKDTPKGSEQVGTASETKKVERMEVNVETNKKRVIEDHGK